MPAHRRGEADRHHAPRRRSCCCRPAVWGWRAPAPHPPTPQLPLPACRRGVTRTGTTQPNTAIVRPFLVCARRRSRMVQIHRLHRRIWAAGPRICTSGRHCRHELRAVTSLTWVWGAPNGRERPRRCHLGRHTGFRCPAPAAVRRGGGPEGGGGGDG
jgi:hypothetical protein